MHLHTIRRTTLKRLRLIDTPPADNGGGSDPETGDAGEPEPDWKAKYEEMRVHSRDWEKKAKANKAAADELAALKESQLSEAEKTAKRIKELEEANAAYEAEKRQAEWKAKISAETGVPADVLKGQTEEDIRTHAEALAKLLHPDPKLPHVADPAKQPSGKPADAESRDYVRKLMGKTNH